VALLAALVFASLAYAAKPPGFYLENTHKTPPVSALGQAPKKCTAYPESGCLQSGSYGSVNLSPHILKPGGILTGKVAPTTACHDCAATWPTSGKQAATELFKFLKPMRGCGALKCRWRVAKDAPETRYTVVQIDISPRPAANGPSSDTTYTGIRSPWAYVYVK
jgi:hypothetical protein